MVSKKNKSLILLLGSYYPPREKCNLKGILQKHKNFKNKKRDNLKPMELFLLVQHKFQEKYKNRFNIESGDEIHKYKRELFNRIFELMKKSKLILILLQNEGGVLVEHGICMDKRLYKKTCNFIFDKSNISNFIRYGTLQHQDKEHYKNSYDLLRMMDTKIHSRLIAPYTPKMKI